MSKKKSKKKKYKEYQQTAFDKLDLLTDEQKDEFVCELADTLEAKEGCGGDLTQARRILDQLGLKTKKVKKVLKYFEKNGGFCDCEILLNVVIGEENQ